MAWNRQLCLAATVWCCSGWAALGQTNPLAAISGRVSDPSGAPVGGVKVEASSPALQGVRETETTSAGDFLVPFLPPGEYAIVFRHEGFRDARAHSSLGATETSRVDIRLELAAAGEEITVSGEPESVIRRSATVGVTYPARLIDRLPTDRSMSGAMQLAPGVGNDFRISGAGTYENLYLVDGVGVKDIVFGLPRPFPVEDAIEGTDTAVAAISAEYGRFAGGVVNLVTRSGGNDLRGSFRTTLRNDAWRSLTPFEREQIGSDPREDAIVPAYEATLGGPLRRDRLWYFLAGRWQKSSSAETLAYTNLPYRYENLETRLETKLTWSPGPGQSLRLAYGEIDSQEENFVFVKPVMDYASLSRGTTPEDLLSIHGSSMVGRNLFLEGQYSHRRRTPTGHGARTTDLLGGTRLLDGSRGGASWNSPALCGVCGVPPGGLRRAEEGDLGYAGKASGFFSGPRAGAHHLVLGGEVAEELRKSNSFQTGSGYLVTAATARLEGGAIYPVFLPGGSTVITWAPIFDLSHGSRFRTTSAFVNDDWRLGGRWRFNLGLRWDADESRDQSTVEVGRSDAWSPRLAATFDPRGDRLWTLDAGFARYVTSLNFQVGDIGTSSGRPARFLYTYNGPAVNASGSSELVSTEDALAILFDWFFAHGGTSLLLRQAPGIPGLNRRVGDDLVPPRCDETTLGVTRRFGDRGFLRLSGVRREFARLYVERADLSTGRVTDPGSGRQFDLRLIENGGRVERTYEALLAQVDLRIGPRLRLAGSYTLSETRGNFDGDGSVPEADLEFFPEYGEERWRAPAGPLESDRRHRARFSASYDVPLSKRRGRLSVSALESVDSGMAWSAVGEIDSRPYVANPGYVGPPARVPYFFEGRGRRRTATATATDLAIHYAVSPPSLGGAELFVRLLVGNLFDESAQTGPGETTVLSAANDPRFAPFDPFVEQPVRGVHWDFAPGFGRALSAEDFQPPRTVEIALGVRF